MLGPFSEISFIQEQQTMLANLNIKRRLLGLPLMAGALLLTAPQASAQTAPNNELSKTTVASGQPATRIMAEPQFTAYRGIQIGTSAEDVRAKLDHLQEKGKMQDFFVFSEKESAQVFYDTEEKVKAISIDYMGTDSNPPTPREVLGEDIQAKADGSMYQLRRYPTAGFWVAYNRTAGNDPVVTITMQKDN
jgi:hypothetical protein